MANLIVGFIKLYKIGVSPIIHWLSFSFFGVRPGCRFSPTCSQYAIQVFSENNFPKASLLVLKRLGRCHPWVNPNSKIPMSNKIPNPNDQKINLRFGA